MARVRIDTEWTKAAAQRARGGTVRLACCPGRKASIPATFAVKKPDRFRQLRMRRDGDWQVCQSGPLEIRVRQDGRRWHRGNLLVQWQHEEKRRSWRPGDLDRENLGGSFQSFDLLNEGLIAGGVQPYDPMKGFDAHVCSPTTLLDQLRDVLRAKVDPEIDEYEWFREFVQLMRDEEPIHLRQWPKEVLATRDRLRRFPPGLLSRSGVTIFLDDSLPWNSREEWIGEHPPDPAPQVLYVVYYGHDYRSGLTRLAEILGPVPRPEDWMLGVWYSCYRRMGEKHYRKVREDFDRHSLPLDAVVVDTDWHRFFWHGFDWEKRLFPNPARFGRWLRKSGLHASFNVHPQYIPEKDSRLPAFLLRTGVPPRILRRNEVPHPFHADCQSVDLFDKTQAKAYFDIFHKPIERDGCDLWWVDGTLRTSAGRDATAWLNELYAREGAGPLVLSRTFGLGAHRSTLHFTGDALSQWRVLEQEAAALPLAANVLLAWVSNDIGGFFKGLIDRKDNKPDTALMVRWVQFGVFSPIFRLHSDHGVREPWRFGKKGLAIMRRFLQLRRDFVAPRLRDLAGEAHQTGASPFRPMYHEFPAEEQAYRHPGQYMMGDRVLVAPVTREDGRVRYWIPPGTWRHLFLDREIGGPCALAEEVPLEVMPVYERADR